MEIRPIKTRVDYKKALREIESLMSAEANTSEGDRLEVLTTLVEAYERVHFPMDLPDPVEAIKFRMEQSGLAAKDLVPMIGQLNRVYEVLNRRRPLTLPMIRSLHKELGIPSELLIQEPVPENRVRAARGLADGKTRGGRRESQMSSYEIAVKLKVLDAAKFPKTDVARKAKNLVGKAIRAKHRR